MREVTNLCKVILKLRQSLVNKVGARSGRSAWWSASARSDVVRIFAVCDFAVRTKGVSVSHGCSF